MNSWELAFEFEPGQVRHIHAVHADATAPCGSAPATATSSASSVAPSTAEARFEWIGHGSQVHRTCAFVGFDDVVLWPTDADFEQNHVVRWQRGTGDMTVDAELPDVTYYATPVDGERALLGLAQGVAQAWVAYRTGAPSRGSTGR